MQIGQLAQTVGVQTSRLRYYESVGLLATPPRISGQRNYSQDAVHRLYFILAAQQAGFTLAEIQNLLRNDNPCGNRWGEVAKTKLDILDATIFRLQRTRLALARSADCACLGLSSDCKLVDEFPSPAAHQKKTGAQRPTAK
jgi:MerR family transcriptional regulator, redox-sensitive transcriptional activator SoxR